MTVTSHVIWLGIGKAADSLGLSTDTLRRRTRDPLWRKDVHWRVVQIGRKRLLQFQLERCRLLEYGCLDRDVMAGPSGKEEKAPVLGASGHGH
jgi:hypothetical protein